VTSFTQIESQRCRQQYESDAHTHCSIDGYAQPGALVETQQSAAAVRTSSLMLRDQDAGSWDSTPTQNVRGKLLPRFERKRFRTIGAYVRLIGSRRIWKYVTFSCSRSPSWFAVTTSPGTLSMRVRKHE